MLQLIRTGLSTWLIFVAACATTPAPAPTSLNRGDSSWIAGSALYEVFVRDFSTAGDFQGVIAGLDRIQATGANVVWLMPIHPIGQLNRKLPLGSSYSVADYRAINPDYGTAADFHALVSAIHARKMKLIIDWVPNHTAWDHVWVGEHPEYYTRNDKGEMSVPRDNAGKLTDWTDVADLDYSNAGLRIAMIASMRFWLEEFGIDGFRVDVAGMVPDAFWREAVPQLRAVKPILLLAEWDEPKMHELGYDLTYGWDSYTRLKAVWRGDSAATFIDRVVLDLRLLPPGGQRMRFTTNHDETAWDVPPVTLFGGAAGARAAFAAMALLPGRPLLYNGQEVESSQKLGLFVKNPIAWGQPDASAARAFYQRVMGLVRSHPAFADGNVAAVPTNAPADVISYRRSGVIVLVNTRPRIIDVVVSGRSPARATDLLTNSVQSGDTVRLAAYGIAVLRIAE